MEPRPWYKKKRYLIPLGVIGLILLVGIGSAGSNSVPAPEAAAVETATQTPDAAPQSPETTTAAPVQTQSVTNTNVETQAAIPVPAGDTTYTNVDGNQVPSPTYAPSAPTGATAQCNDGTYSFSQHRSGTCSHHGGVAEWL